MKVKKSNWRKANYRFFRDQFESLPRNAKILDVGSGKGTWRDFIPEFTHVDTLDDQSFPEVKFVHDLSRPLPFSDGAYDGIVLSNTLEHIPNTEELLKECYRVCKSGGMVIGSVPFIHPLHQAPRDFYRFTRYGLEFRLRQAGWREVRVAALGRPADAYLMIQNMFFAETAQGIVRVLWRIQRILNGFNPYLKKGAPPHDSILCFGYGFTAKK